jgi:hypothetical protein
VATITLRSKNPLDPRPDELEDLAQAIQRCDPELEVIIATGEPPQVGVSLWEVIEVYVEWSEITVPITVALIPELVSWMREGFKKMPGRPKSAYIYGPNGEVLRTIELKGPDEEPEVS